MTPPLWHLFAAFVGYLGLLFLVAYAAERGWLPQALARHPLVYALSLGVYTTSWTYYGSVGFAASQGYLFLTIYIGVTLAFMLAPVLLQPVLRLTRDYQLSSLADLFAFRYPHRLTGSLVTLFMLAGLLPYISLQIEAVVTSVQVLTHEAPPQLLALVFCATITLFAVLFGARQVTPREKHEGLVVAIAFESAIKLAALAAVALFALFGVLGGPAGLGTWLSQHPQALDALYRPVREGPWATLLLLAFSAAFLLPRQFQMVFTENIDPRGLGVASWAFPLFLLLLNLGIPLVLWAGQHLQLPVPPDYYLLALTLEAKSPWLTLFAFIGGISAASAMIIVESLALAAMTLNHLILPVALRVRPAPEQNLYAALLWTRRALIAGIIFTGYAAYLTVDRVQGLAQLGLISFVAVAQFLPAIIALLVWSRANRVGFLAGVTGGMLVWLLVLVVPLIGSPALSPLQDIVARWPLQAQLDVWQFATFWSLSLNTVLFVGGSLLTRPNAKEIAADRACRLDAALLLSGPPQLRSVRHLELRVGRVIGADAAQSEVRRARLELGIGEQERRPRQLHFLHERVERNLSGLIGPQLARTALASADNAPDGGSPRSLLIEEQLERSQVRLQGLAAELNELRRFHRQILHDLPVGVCSLGHEQDILLWNERMAAISGIAESEALGARLDHLPPPWNELLTDFLAGGESRRYKQRVQLGGRTRWLNLFREAVGGSHSQTALLVEDLTEQQLLEAELEHSERLASIGRFAAGIAHEIGNPLTGISSLAQNLRAEHDDPVEVEATLTDILQQTRRISEIVRSLLTFSHAGSGELATARFALLPCVQEAIRLVRLSPAGRDRDFRCGLDPELMADADRGRLLQVLVNLLGNAADASPPGGLITVTARPEAGGVLLQVHDRGCGMSPEVQDRVFEPFFTTKQPGQGTGLGLAVVYSIVREHGGTVQLESREGTGTTVSLRLPTRSTG